MTLHEAIKQILQDKGQSMTTNEIANELNKKGLYQKKDGTEISDFQVHGRTKSYPNIFNRNGAIVSLVKYQKGWQTTKNRLRALLKG